MDRSRRVPRRFAQGGRRGLLSGPLRHVLGGGPVGNTTAWFNAAAALPAPVPGLPGSEQTLITSLEPATTYYIGLKSVDDAANGSDVDSKTRGGGSQATVPVKGIAGVTNLTAVTGAQTGEVTLSWSAPRQIGAFAPLSYELRASSVAQIDNNNDFEAARPLSTFSPSAAPTPAAPGALEVFTASGLVPGATYYFALRMKDSGGTPFKGVWTRSAGLNPLNAAQARFSGERPTPITDLTALPGAQVGQIRVTWTAPQNPSGVPLVQYVIKASTRSIASLAGDATAWFNLADSTTVLKSPVLLPRSCRTTPRP